jgi:hypothetical protein
MPTNEHLVLCGGATAQESGGGTRIELNLHDTSANVRLEIEDISRRLLANISSVHADFLEIASYIYAADSAIPRGGGTDAQLGARWRRKLRLVIPTGSTPARLAQSIRGSKRSRPMATAETIAKILGGRKADPGWTAYCPAHDDRTPSFSISDSGDRKVLVLCHAGCEQERTIASRQSLGLWEERGHRRLARPTPRIVGAGRPDRNDAERNGMALPIWQAAKPAGGSVFESYRVSRSLNLPPTPTLRVHGALSHPARGIWPAMIDLVTPGFAAAPQRTAADNADRSGGGDTPTAQANLLKSHRRTAADRADANLAPQSALEKTGAPGWGLRL